RAVVATVGRVVVRDAWRWPPPPEAWKEHLGAQLDGARRAGERRSEHIVNESSKGAEANTWPATDHDCGARSDDGAVSAPKPPPATGTGYVCEHTVEGIALIGEHEPDHGGKRAG